MKSQLNILKQLQELVLTKDEHLETGDGKHLDALNESIETLQHKLDPTVAALYNRLYARSARNHVVMAAMSNGCCSACGMQVPIAQSQQVRLAQHLVTCSSCGRILFADEADAARNTGRPQDRDEARTGISRFSAEELVVPILSAKTKEEAIVELAGLMETNNFVANADSLVTAALDREGVLSTAVGSSLAFPHVRGVEGGALTLAMGVSKKGIDWGGEKVRVVFLSAIPVAVSAFYLRLMSGLVQSFSKKDSLAALLDAKDRPSLWKALVKATRHYVK